MYTIKTESSFDAAHFLQGYEGKCSNIHGHRWRVIIEIKTEKLSSEKQTRAMVCDFASLKKALNDETDVFDHTFIIEKDSLKSSTLSFLKEEGFALTEVPFRPTAEAFAEYFYGRFSSMGYNVKRSIVYETPNNCASYSEE